MAYRYGDRYQMQMLPQSMGEYVAPDDPVRAYDAFVGEGQGEGKIIKISPFLYPSH